MAGAWVGRSLSSSSRAIRRRRRGGSSWKRLGAVGALALLVSLSTAQVALAAADDPTGTSSTTTTSNPAGGTTSTTAPATSTTSTTSPQASTTTTTNPAPDTPAPPAPNATTTLLVQTKSGLSSTEQSSVIVEHGGTERDAIAALRIHVVEVPAADAFSALAGFQSDLNVASVSVDTTRTVESGATDPGYASQWSLSQIGWDQVHGHVDVAGSAKLAVLDTGVDAVRAGSRRSGDLGLVHVRGW